MAKNNKHKDAKSEITGPSVELIIALGFQSVNEKPKDYYNEAIWGILHAKRKATIFKTLSKYTVDTQASFIRSVATSFEQTSVHCRLNGKNGLTENLLAASESVRKSKRSIRLAIVRLTTAKMALNEVNALVNDRMLNNAIQNLSAFWETKVNLETCLAELDTVLSKIDIDENKKSIPISYTKDDLKYKTKPINYLIKECMKCAIIKASLQIFKSPNHKLCSNVLRGIGVRGVTNEQMAKVEIE